MLCQQRHYATAVIAATCLEVICLSTVAIGAPPSRTSIKLFEARPVMESGPAVTDEEAVMFDHALLLMGCPAKPTAVISSSPDGTGHVIVDDILAVNSVNVCTAQPGGMTSFRCFQSYFGQVGDLAIDAYQPVAPLNISRWVPSGPWHLVTFELKDVGTVLANSDIWLVTNCVIHNKAELCHKPGTPAEHAISVAQSSVSAHLSHGDYLGQCR